MAIVPIRWDDRRGSRMRARPGLAVRVAWDLFRIPLIHRAERTRRRPVRVTGTVSARRAPARLARAALPIVAILVFAVRSSASTLAVAGDTLGFDFLAYHQAAAACSTAQPALRP